MVDGSMGRLRYLRLITDLPEISEPTHGTVNHKRHEFAHGLCLVARGGGYSIVPGRHVAVLQTTSPRRVTGWIVSSTLPLDHSAAGRPSITRRSSYVVGVARSRPWSSQRIFRDRSATGPDDE